MKKIWIIGLLVTLVLIAGCYGTKTTSIEPTTTAIANSVEIKGFAFNPAAITIAKGTTVRWTHNDNAPHTVTTTSAPVDFDFS